MNRYPNRIGDRIVFWVCLVVLFVFLFEAVYRLGKTHGMVETKPCVAAKSVYDMNKKQLRRMIRYEQAKGEVK